MLTNPAVLIAKQKEKERREREAFRHSFIVTCVVPYIEELSIHPSFRFVKQFCEENQVPFSTREYDSDRYKEDRDEISRMPAFHMYDKNGHSHFQTFFHDENPIQKIQTEIISWQKAQERKQARKEMWERKVSGLISFFEGLSFKRKPKMNVPERPKSLPAKIPLEYIDSLPKNRRGSL